MASDAFSAHIKTRPVLNWSMKDVDFIGDRIVIPVRTRHGLETHVHPAPWSPEYKDWGFDEIYPAEPKVFDQVEAWDREHRGRWIEPAPSALSTFGSILKQEYTAALRDYVLDTHRMLLFGGESNRHLTYGQTMKRDLTHYADATDPLRLTRSGVKRLVNQRHNWRRHLALKLAPELQEDW